MTLIDTSSPTSLTSPNQSNTLISSRSIKLRKPFNQLYKSTILLIRQEYLTLHELITDAPETAIVVTGQEGNRFVPCPFHQNQNLYLTTDFYLLIGKSTFLLYLLLHRVEHKQPTAVQFSPDWTFIFDEHGVNMMRTANVDSVRLKNCWGPSR